MIKDNIIDKIKNFIDGDTPTDQQFIQNLKNETNLLLSMCNVFNADKQMMNKLNSFVKTTPNNPFTAQDFVLSDLISIYNNQVSTDKSKFILSYYHDVLTNNSIPSKMTTIDEVKNNKLITSIYNDKDFSFILTSCNANQEEKVMSMYENFAKFAFNLKINREATQLQNNITKPIKQEAIEVESNINVDVIPQGDTLEKVMDELNQLIGLESVKTDVNELINLLKVQKLRESEGLKNVDVTLHNVFLGPPGTGKTTVARLLSRIYFHLGFLSKGQVYETDREGLVAGYVGQTATKVNKVVEESLGGVLFIDEAYSLTPNLMGSNDYGSEAINTLLKRMEDHRDDLSVVVAGYTEPMKEFIESNHGLRSRFNRYFHFEHFNAKQLMQIFEGYCKNGDFILDKDAKEKLSDTIEMLVEKRDDSFGNARVMRNLFEKCTQNQANRIIKLKKIGKRTLKTFKEDDIPEPNETVANVTLTAN